MQELSKRQKRLMHEWAGIAYERDLRAALLNLRREFDHWASGEIDACDSSPAFDVSRWATPPVIGTRQRSPSAVKTMVLPVIAGKR